MKVLVFNHQKDVKISLLPVKRMVKEVLVNEDRFTDEVSVYFVSVPEICRLHQLYFNQPTPTDCISFPLDEEEQDNQYHILGEVFVCPQAALEYDREEVYRELSLYVVHGLLHLLGYDDIDPKKRRAMRAAEKKQMELLTQKNLLLKPYKLAD